MIAFSRAVTFSVMPTSRVGESSFTRDGARGFVLLLSRSFVLLQHRRVERVKRGRFPARRVVPVLDSQQPYIFEFGSRSSDSAGGCTLRHRLSERPTRRPTLTVVVGEHC